MNIIASAVVLTVGHPAASSRFFTSHLGFREVLAADDVIHSHATTRLPTSSYGDATRRRIRCDSAPRTRK